VIRARAHAGPRSWELAHSPPGPTRIECRLALRHAAAQVQVRDPAGKLSQQSLPLRRQVDQVRLESASADRDEKADRRRSNCGTDYKGKHR